MALAVRFMQHGNQSAADGVVSESSTVQFPSWQINKTFVKSTNRKCFSPLIALDLNNGDITSQLNDFCAINNFIRQFV